MIIDIKEQTPNKIYHLMTSIIVPRPIAWVVTEGRVTNIAPFSYFTALSSDPATVLISIGHRPDGSPKDTLRNLRETKRCAICIVGQEHFEAMHFSSKSLAPEESELDIFDIQTERIFDGYPPVPVGIKATLFGKYMKEVELPGKTVPVIIEIEHLYADESVITDPDKLKIEMDAIARMGGDYRVLGDRLKVSEVG